MHESVSAEPAALRLFECWLPLAQALNEQQGWGADGPALEQLIRHAEPLLRVADSVSAARAILLVYRMLIANLQ